MRIGGEAERKGKREERGMSYMLPQTVAMVTHYHHYNTDVNWR